MSADVVIATDRLTRRYGAAVAVDGVSFSVARNRVTGFLGRNGAGKSTTLKMLLGMLAPSAGSATVLGHRIDDPAGSLAIRRQIAYVGEDKGLYAYMTVGELVRFTRSFYSDWRPDLEKRLLAQLALPTDRKVKALSKGMRTKLALLLALARQPQILILDEPSDGLDPVATEELLAELAGRSADGTTIFFSSHQLEEVERIADDVVMLDRGHVVLEASLDEVRAHFRRVVADFPAPPDPAGLRMPGVRTAQVSGRQLSTLVTENVDAVVARAQKLGATAVRVDPVGLREVFLDRVTRP